MKNSKYMKIAVIFLFILFVIVSVLGCVTHVHSNNNSNKIPPGQAKKISGSKSAKAYAPGQQKKR